ncbi:MAG: flavodoxin [Planctomycetota bacterium]
MKIAIIYGTTTGMTLDIAEQIKQNLGDLADAPHDIGDFDPADIANYDALLLGIPTWDVGEMQYDWEMAMESFAVPELAGKKVALFGCGDQEGYPDTFGDALGLLWDGIQAAGPTLIGRWPTDGYNYDASAGERDGKFLGLICDEDNQADQTPERVTAWCEQIKQELGVAPATV